MDAAGGTDELRGEVAALVFANPATGFGVVELAAPRGSEGPRASGPLAALVPGQSVRLVGRWVEHERYGPTFEALAYEHAAPRSVAGLVTFLSSPRFPGVGRKTAERLVQTFGLGVGRVISDEPERLREIRGVSAEMAERIASSWRAAGALGVLVAELTAVGVSATAAAAVARRFGDDAADVVATEPYQLLTVPGVRWAHVETLGRRAGIERTDPRRLAAGAWQAQRQRCARGGHVACRQDELVADARRLLSVDAVDAQRGLQLAGKARLLVRDHGDGDQPLWWTPADLAAERRLADELARLLTAKSKLPQQVREHAGDPQLTAEQAAAVTAAVTSPVSVLTGGPGTGKTRTIAEILAACAGGDVRVALCAPTGRAAKRMEEVTGHGATTIHRLLEARPAGDDDDGQAGLFGFDRDRRLPFDMVIADEWSMADTRLAAALVSAVPDGAHLVLVGDSDQLPSVGAGAVLRDLLALPAADAIAVTRLTTVHRQAASSRIVTLAHEIRAAAVPPLRGRNGDVFVVAERPDGIADRVAEIVAVRAPDFYGIPPAGVQVLAPMYRGPAGVDRLNERLKHRLNPAAGRRAVAGFHEGDRVVSTRNDGEVANGDIGEVTATDPAAGALEVTYPFGAIDYDLERASDLAPAWCLTVHKAQGSEWPVVVLVLDGAHRAMLWRELVYTAVTRARSGLLLVGDASLLSAAARRTGSGAMERVTRLGPRLAEAIADQGGLPADRKAVADVPLGRSS